MKKILLTTLIASLCLTAVFAAPKKAKKSKAKTIKIGVIQLVEHSALDANYKGFVDGLAEAGYVDGKNIKIDYQNAQGEQANCITIAQKLINDKDDLIFAIATPAAQAVANLTQDIPILVSSVTDPESAKLVKSNDAPGGNVTGTSDLTPCAAQMKLLKQLVPSAKTVGMLYCSSEQNSYFQIALAKKACDELGLKYIDATVSVLDTEHGKPAPDPMLLACERLGLAPDECLCVGDSPFDIQSGNAAGCYTVAVEYTQLDWQNLLEQGKPDYTIAQPLDLLKLLDL